MATKKQIHNSHRFWLPFLLIAWVIGPNIASAVTYYVATNGDDNHTKVQAQNIGTPWQTIDYGASQLSAGDTLLVRGGTYREEIGISVSGTAENRITIKNYPDETPIIDGSEVVTGWTACEDAAAAGGNENWANIYYAYLPAETTLFTANLFQNNERLAIAQSPNPSDVFYIDDHTEHHVLQPDDVTTTTITDANLATYGGSDLVGCRITLWGGSNEIFYPLITDYNVDTTTITFEEVSSVYEDRDSAYSILNCLDANVLSREGEYVINETPEGDGTHKVWLWPLDSQDLSATGEVTVSLNSEFIKSNGYDYFTFDGLHVTKGINTVVEIKNANGITFKNCEFYNCKGGTSAENMFYTETVTDCIWENNTLYNNQGRLRGLVSVIGNNIITRNNTITNIGGTCIWYVNVDKGQITGNTVTGSTGSHSNGLSVYQGCSNILVASNIVINSNIALSWQAMEGDLIVYNNLFHNWGLVQYTIANWGNNTNGAAFYLLNNIILGSSASSSTATHVGSFPGGEYSINNIIEGDMDWMKVVGSAPYPENYAVRENNLYTDYAWSQKANFGWVLRDSEILQTDESTLFNDPKPNTDYTTKVGSRGINAGTDISEYLPTDTFSDYNFGLDIAGNPRVSGTIDIGAYEYAAGVQDSIPPVIETIEVHSPVNILFNESLDETSAETISNYSISPNITINSATLQPDNRTVVLETSAHQEAIEYTLTANGVKDIAGNATSGETKKYWYSDNLPDDWEIDHFGDINLYGDDDDPDGDGISNLDEYNSGTDPASSANNVPVAQDDNYSMGQDTILTASAALGILANDSDQDGDTLTALLISNVSHGTLILNANGSFTYTPQTNYNGLDVFTYKANDGTADSVYATVRITINESAPATYTLAVTTANGTVTKTPNQTTYNAGESVTLLATAANGYYFTSWSGDLTGSTNPATITMDGNKSITANYQTNTYSLAVAATNGTVAKSPDQATYQHGDTVTLTAAPASGYHFTGWSGDLTGSTNPATVTMDADKSVTAGFAVNTYGLNVTATNGSVSKTPDKASYNHGDTVTLLATANAGYNFTNWSGDLTGSTNPTTITMDGNKSITANYQTNTYSLAVTATNGSMTKTPDQTTYNHGDTVSLLLTADTGYNFVGWAGDLAGSDNPAAITMDGNKSITANCQANTYTLAVSAANGTITRSPDQASYTHNNSVTMTATPATGYHFTGWSGDLTGNANPVTITMDGNKSIAANFAVNTYTLNVAAATNGSVNKTPDKAAYNHGDNVTLSATANAGYNFTNWSGDLAGSVNPTTITMDGNKSITADYQTNTYSLAVTATNGTVNKSPSQATYQHGDTVTLTATPASGYHFTGWSGDLTGTANPAAITMDADKSVTADFVINTYTLNIAATNGSVSKTPDKAAYNHGDTVTLSATANAGYNFTNWSGDLTGSVNPTTITMDGNKSITADYQTNTYSLAVTATNGTVSKSPDQATYQHGDTVTFTAAPASGYQFTGWSGDLTGTTNPAAIIMDADKSVTANFVINTYALNVIATNGSVSKTPDKTTYNHGDTVTLSATANAGYKFTGWSGDLTDSTNPVTIAMDDAKSVTAVFARKNLDTDDVTAPTVANCSPRPDSIQAPLNTLTILHVVDIGAGVDPNSVVIRIQNDIIYAGGATEYASDLGRCRRTGTKADYTFTYQPKAVFNYDQTINVMVNATDLGGNPMPQYVYSFKTEMRIFGGKRMVGPDTANLPQEHAATVLDSNGNIWIVWQAGSTGSRNIYIAKQPAGANAFESSIQITDDPYDQCNPAIAIDSNDKLYLAWQDNSKGNWDVWFSSSTDGVNFSQAVKVANTNANQTNPVLAVDSHAPTRIYIAWQDDRKGNYDIYIAASSDDFTDKVITPIATDSADQTEPAIAVDADNTVYLIWTDARNGSTDIYGVASNYGSWTNVPIVNNSHNQTSPAIDTEPEGNILHLLWVDDTSGNKDIYYGAISEALPDSPLTGINIVDDSSGANQSCPTITTSLDSDNNLKVFACWQDDRNILEGNNDSDIYFAETEPVDRLLNPDSQLAFGTNIWVTDDDLTNAFQYRPVMNSNINGHPYILWCDTTNGTADIYYVGTTLISSEALAKNKIIASKGGFVGTRPDNITSGNDVSVEIPAGAFCTDVEVSIRRIDNPPSSATMTAMDIISSYEFGPSSSMEFPRPVTITIPYAVTDIGDESVYWYNIQTGNFSQSGVSNIEHIIISPTLHAIRYKTTHFTQYVVARESESSQLPGGDGGGGCSMSRYGYGQGALYEIIGYFLPYIMLAVVLLVLKQRNAHKSKS